MNERTEGAWILSHANKLLQIEEHNFEEIDIAGKAGRLLSGLVASHEESILNREKVLAIAKAAGTNKAELPTLLNFLAKEHLIDQSSKGDVVSLGVTTSAVLGHTSKIFKSLNPSENQKAVITLAESITSKPVLEKDMREYISDTHKLTLQQTDDVFAESEEIGFIDAEIVDDEKLLFNGNLFKHDTLKKATKVLDSLNPEERKAFQYIEDEITKKGVITFDKAVKISGRPLLEKLQSIGLFEFSKVSNDLESKLFITKPEAFSKFGGSPFEEDALDLAKSFVASLSYGMNYSSSSRGRIDLLYHLLRALIAGRTVGPATAIGKDYKYLEIKRVVQIIPHDRMFSMRLLKKEVGELALQVMQIGDAAESVLLPNSSNITAFDGPEKTRRYTRRKRQIKRSDVEVANIIRTLRN